ncbi:cation:proton antiporter [Kitasatospora sp. NPDC052868]|uniref:cation:proton antiporter n=1 Tax=Kitasatospora sp. NPDC052868 TaxID=3364060 RepID=UPI0037C6B87C
MLASAPLPPLGSSELLVLLLQAGVLLGSAHLLGRLAVRCALPSLVGELCAGVLLGPSLLQQVLPAVSQWLFPHRAEQLHLLDAVGQLGVLLLVGLTGLELDLGLARRKGRTAARVSAWGLLVPFALGVVTAFRLPAALTRSDAQPTVFALFLGVAMCVTAIPVIAKTLIDMDLLHRDVGQLTLMAGLVDDVFGWTMLSLISAMAGAGLTGAAVTGAVLSLAVLVAGALLLGRVLIRPLFRRLDRSGDRKATTGAFVTLVLLGAAGSQALHLEAVFGAFVCGVLVNAYGRPDPARLAPLRSVTTSVLAPLFFATAGLRMDLMALGGPLVLAGALAVLGVAVLGKFAGAYIGARSSGLAPWEGIALGAGMNARGVVEVVIAMVGLRLGILSTPMYTVILLVAVATSVMAPPLLRRAMARLPETAEEAARYARQTAAPSAPAVPASPAAAPGG